MPLFSTTSMDRLRGCEVQLRVVCNTVIEIYDMSVICGHRNQVDQGKAYFDGFSDKIWPNSKHNSKPSRAVDLYPYPIDLDDTKRFCVMAGFVLCVAAQKKIRIRWGGAWGDYGHFEIR